MRLNIKHRGFDFVLAFVLNMLMMYVVYALCRIEFVFVNRLLLLPGLYENSWIEILKGSLRFDTAGLLYLNSLYAIVMLLPLRLRRHGWYQAMSKWIFIVVNSVGVVANLADSLYYPFTGRRTTFSVLSEFGNEDNMWRVFGVAMLDYWYVVLFGIVLIAAMWFCYVKPCSEETESSHSLGENLIYYVTHCVILLIYVGLTVIGIRGGATKATRPITLSNANQYVNTPKEAAVILNTPFSFIRTISNKPFPTPQYMSDTDAESLYTPLHEGKADGEFIGKNVVIIIVESFGREYWGFFNKDIPDYAGYTPFMDSLAEESLTFEYSFCNGRKSIDGMPSILSSIPMFVEPFVLTSASMNDVGGIARELGKMGYHSAFFHGAQNGSMGFQAFARSTGFDEYYGRSEYDNDARTDGESDFDGTWAIWDEPFLQYYALKMSDFTEPFVTSVFTASSHHPFKVPEQYIDSFDKGVREIHQCIGYTDHSLREFFTTAKKQPWFENTIFVITSDHTNQSAFDYYQTDLGYYCSPILFYDPSGALPRQMRKTIAQHIDIMPTLLGMLNYPHPYLAFGKDLTRTSDDNSWAVNYNSGIYQYVTHDRKLIEYDGEHVKGIYDITTDWMLTNNMADSLSTDSATVVEIETLKSIIQQYMKRMNNNQLIY